MPYVCSNNIAHCLLFYMQDTFITSQSITHTHRMYCTSGKTHRRVMRTVLSLLLLALMLPTADAINVTSALPGIIDLTEATFNEAIGKDRAVFVAFYTTWCVRCPNAAEELQQLGIAYDNSSAAQRRLVLGRVNAETERNLTRRLKISIYPSFFFFPIRSRYPHRYRGWFTANSVVTYLQNRMNDLNLTLPPQRGALREVTAADFDAVVHNGVKDVVLLLEGNNCTRCAKAHETMGVLAKIFQNDDERIAFAWINVSTESGRSKVSEHYKLMRLPMILYVVRGLTGTGMRYRNERSLVRLLEFVNLLSGLQRTIRGDRMSSYGVYDVLLRLLRKAVVKKSPSALERMKDKAYVLNNDKMVTKYYVHLAEQHEKFGLDEDYIEQQISRLQRTLLSVPREDKRHDTVSTQLNILNAAKRTLFPH